MNTEIVKIEAKDFGIEEAKATEIANQFKPMLEKMQELEKEYNEILKLDFLDPFTASKAKEVRLQYVKVRTGTSAIHATQKAFYLAGGRFVDGWKNAQIFASQGIEEKLMEIEKYPENIEKERVSKLHQARVNEISAYYEYGVTFPNFGIMQDDIWSNYITGAKVNYENKIESERKSELERIENERLDKVSSDRRFEIAPYAKFNKGNQDLRLMSNDDYSELLKSLMDAKKVYEHEQEKIRLENEKLKKEAKIQAEKNVKVEAEKNTLQSEIDEKNKAEREAKQVEDNRIEADKKEAERLDKAPDKEKLKLWFAAILIKGLPTDNLKPESVEIANDIMNKFESFKKWARNEIDKL